MSIKEELKKMQDLHSDYVILAYRSGVALKAYQEQRNLVEELVRQHTEDDAKPAKKTSTECRGWVSKSEGHTIHHSHCGEFHRAACNTHEMYCDDCLCDTNHVFTADNVRECQICGNATSNAQCVSCRDMEKAYAKR